MNYTAFAFVGLSACIVLIMLGFIGMNLRMKEIEEAIAELRRMT